VTCLAHSLIIFISISIRPELEWNPMVNKHGCLIASHTQRMPLEKLLTEPRPSAVIAAHMARGPGIRCSRWLMDFTTSVLIVCEIRTAGPCTWSGWLMRHIVPLPGLQIGAEHKKRRQASQTEITRCYCESIYLTSPSPSSGRFSGPPQIGLT